MKIRLMLISLATCACEPQAAERAAEPSQAAPAEIAAEAPSSKPPEVIPKPEDPAELDRMILAGYTPHGPHLHPPGVKECPLIQANDAVM